MGWFHGLYFPCPGCPRGGQPTLPGTRYLRPWHRRGEKPKRQKRQRTTEGHKSGSKGRKQTTHTFLPSTLTSTKARYRFVIAPAVTVPSMGVTDAAPVASDDAATGVPVSSPAVPARSDTAAAARRRALFLALRARGDSSSA